MYAAINADRDIKFDAQETKNGETIAAVALPPTNKWRTLVYQINLKQPVRCYSCGNIWGENHGTFAEVVLANHKPQLQRLHYVQQIFFDGSYIVGVQATKAFFTLMRK